MITSPVYELKSDEFNKLLAEALKQIPEFEVPEWSLYVKTGLSRQRPPVEDDFWYKRAASILRQAYVRKVVGVNRLKTRYGSKYNRGMRPERFRKASGKMIRVILQQAETAGLLEKYNVPGKRAGRKLTAKGKELMESINAESISPKNNSSEEQKISEKPEIKQEDEAKIEIKEDKQEVKE